MIARGTLVRLVFPVALLLTPVWGRTHAGRLPWLYLMALACAVAFFATPIVRAAAQAWGVLDHPAERKVHRVATPLLGGAAVYGAFAVTVLANFEFSRPLKGVAVGGTIIVVLGILDDAFEVPAWAKLCGQVGAAAAALAYGVVLDTVPNWIPGFLWLNMLLTVLGFLPYNFRPGGATIFLGDSGASFIGFTLAGLAAMGVWADNNPVVSLFTPTLILGVPLFDIAFVGVVRVLTGRVHSVAEWLAYTGKDHIHHRFESLGLTKRQSVLLIFFIATTLGLGAILLKDATPREAALVLVQAACVLAIVAVLEGVGRGHPRG